MRPLSAIFDTDLIYSFTLSFILFDRLIYLFVFFLLIHWLTEWLIDWSSIDQLLEG